METQLKQQKIIKNDAKTVYIEHPTSNWGVFCFNSTGDLFLNSDWGVYGFAWRNYGNDFREFLIRTTAEYVVSKFEYNYRMTTRKDLPEKVKKHIINLFKEFQNII